MSSIKGNMIIGQSGGPTAVINQSLIGAVMEALEHEEIGEIYGALNGVVGIMGERFIDFRKESKENLMKIANTPSSALGSCRHKPTREDCEKIFEICKKHNIRYYFYIGGNDSAESADIVNSIARKKDYELRVFHIPKTIDNDLRNNDHCPGYASAAKYVAMCFMGNDMDNRSLPGVKIDIVMGRNAGWLTAASSLAKFSEDAGPHLIYLPEHPVSLDQIAGDIKNVYDKYGRCMVAVSEGVRSLDGELMIKSMIKEVDSHGNLQLSGTGALGDFLVAEVKARLGSDLRVRSDTLGYAQRCFPTIVSEIDAQEAFAVGREAVKYAMKGDIDGSIGITRIGDGIENDYCIETSLIELSSVAKNTKDLPKKFINAEGNGVTKAFVDYLKPLVGELPEMGLLEKNMVKID